MHARLRQKSAVTESIVELEFELDQPVDYTPGQYARVDIGDDDWRDYTIVDLHGRRVVFLVDTAPGGAGTRFAAAISPGNRVSMQIPLGGFTLEDTDRPKVLVATGTGLAPFIAMVKDAVRGALGIRLEVIFGCRRPEDDLASLYLPRRAATPQVDVTVCLSDARGRDGYRPGYVTQALAERQTPPDDNEYYICGNADMVADVTDLLQRRGARYVYTEPY